MLIEILIFFAIASGLTTLAAVLPRVPAARPVLGAPLVLLLLATAAWATAWLTSDRTAGLALGVGALAVWILTWRALPRWGAVAAAMLSSLTLAAIAYIAYAAAQTAAQATGPIVIVASIVLLLMEIAAMALTLSYAYEILEVVGHRDPVIPAIPTITGTPLPRVALQVPTYNEPVEVVRQTLESLALVDYPNLLVQVVDNNTKDPAVWRPLEQLCKELGPRFTFLHLEDWPGFKAGALNEATRLLPPDVEVLGIIDADYIVNPDFLRATAAHFADPAVAFVQSAQHYRDWEDDGYLRGLFYSYRYFFDVTMPARARHNAIIFCGTMGLIRRTVLIEIGGWNPDIITEDSEASLRMLGTGRYRGIYDPRPWGAGLMPLTFQGLKQQRFRWALGGIQILRKHWRELFPFARHRLRLSRWQRIHYLLGSVQWFGEVLTLVFSLLLVLTAVTTATHHRLPVRQLTGAVLVIPVVFLVTGLLRALWALRRTTGCRWGDALRALRVWFALSWVVTLACLRGLVTSHATFLRTPKSRGGKGTLLRALRACTGETLIAAVGVLAAAAMLIRSPGLATVLLAVLLAFTVFVYSSAPWASAAAEGIKLTPFRRAQLRSAQSTGLRPVTWRTGRDAFAAGTGLALAAAVIAALVIASPSDRTPFTRGPSDLPPVGRLGNGTPATPATQASPLPSQTPQPSATPTATSWPTPSPTPSPTP